MRVVNDRKNNYEIKISDDDEQKIENSETLDANKIEEPNNVVNSKPEANKDSEENSYLERLQRLQAEFMNYKKRVEKERMELSNFYKSELVGSLLPVIDDFERMLDHANDENNEFSTGVKLVYQKFIDVLSEQGLKSINAKGQKFDPSIHEAVLIENSDDGEDEVVAEEWRKGYLFNERLLRPAQVKVLKSEKVDDN